MQIWPKAPILAKNVQYRKIWTHWATNKYQCKLTMLHKRNNFMGARHLKCQNNVFAITLSGTRVDMYTCKYVSDCICVCIKTWTEQFNSYSNSQKLCHIWWWWCQEMPYIKACLSGRDRGIEMTFKHVTQEPKLDNTTRITCDDFFECCKTLFASPRTLLRFSRSPLS